MNPAILDGRPLGNTSKLRALCCLGQDAGSQHLGAEPGNLHSSVSTLHVGSRSQGTMLYSADPRFVYKHGIVPVSKARLNEMFANVLKLYTHDTQQAFNTWYLLYACFSVRGYETQQCSQVLNKQEAGGDKRKQNECRAG